MQIGRRMTTLSVFFILTFAVTAFANNTAVVIEAPKTTKAGSTITITVKVNHSGNSFFHYTDSVRLMAGTSEIAHWQFTRGDRPEDKVFTRQVEYTINDTVDMEAIGNCNLHGSAGPAKVTIVVE
jgi:desulfoferrodoxin (superoxide reductase-like protein)